MTKNAWNSIFNEEYSDYSDDDDYDPYDKTGKYGQYGTCSRGVNKSSTGWCCRECEKDRMRRRKMYNKMRENWFMNGMCNNYCPPDKPTWTNKNFFDSDECFNHFRYTYVDEQEEERPLSLDWKVLGLIPPKTLKEVKRQYHKMARKLHPDKGGDHNKFIELQNSYNNLVAICS